MEKNEDSNRGVLLGGYVEDRIAAGDRRQYRYPENGLPKVLRTSQKLESSLVVALKKLGSEEWPTLFPGNPSTK